MGEEWEVFFTPGFIPLDDCAIQGEAVSFPRERNDEESVDFDHAFGYNEGHRFGFLRKSVIHFFMIEVAELSHRR